MARFRGMVQGSRGEASRLGNKRIDAWADGWDIGIYATAYAQGEVDYAAANLTGGSGGGSCPRLGMRYTGETLVAYLDAYRLVKEDGRVKLLKGDEVLFESPQEGDGDGE